MKTNVRVNELTQDHDEGTFGIIFGGAAITKTLLDAHGQAKPGSTEPPHGCVWCGSPSNICRDISLKEELQPHGAASGKVIMIHPLGTMNVWKKFMAVCPTVSVGSGWLTDRLGLSRIPFLGFPFNLQGNQSINQHEPTHKKTTLHMKVSQLLGLRTALQTLASFCLTLATTFQLPPPVYWWKNKQKTKHLNTDLDVDFHGN